MKFRQSRVVGIEAGDAQVALDLTVRAQNAGGATARAIQGAFSLD